MARLVDAVGVGQSFLFEDRDAHPVARVEPVGLVDGLVEPGRRGAVAGAACNGDPGREAKGHDLHALHMDEPSSTLAPAEGSARSTLRYHSVRVNGR